MNTPVPFRLLIASSILALAGCNTAGYYLQAIEGHLDVMRRAVPFEEVMAQRGAEDGLARRLARIRAIRDFASRELALPDNGSYRRYADLGRPYVLWNVYAAPELSVRPAESCFLIAGCVAYRGFYAESDARIHANELARKGLDTHVNGVPAYSTLGWFDDPVLSTFINFSDSELARIIFHELAHQVAYVRDDSRFNESFAVAVEQEGVRRWLSRLDGDRAGEESQRWTLGQSRREEFFALLIRHRTLLASIYASTASDSEKRMAKARQFQSLADDYQLLKKSWNGFSGYDRFFSQGANNATLASVAVYSDLVPGFAALIEKHNHDMKSFFTEVKDLAQRDSTIRAQALGATAPMPEN